jgi:hypothetical protein
MAWSSNDQYKIVADKIVSSDPDMVVSVAGGLYINSIVSGNKVATMDDIGEGGGSSADIADFTFTFEGSEANEDALSKIAISNHDMSIQTTRDDEQDADITLDSADDVFIIANGDDIHLDAADDVRITTDMSGEPHTWEFDNIGVFRLTQNGYIENLPAVVGENGGFATLKLVADDQDETSVIIASDGVYLDGTDNLGSKVATFSDLGNQALRTETGPFTENHTLELTDFNKVVVMNGTTLTVFVPLNETVPFPIGTRVFAYNAGASTFTVAGVEGVTVRNATTVAQFQEVYLRKRGENEWVLQL